MAIHNGKNAASNLAASLAHSVIGLVMTPFYLQQIGLEGLGLIGLMLMISLVVGVFVAGASKNIQRDISNANATCRSDLHGLVVGGCIIFGIIGIILSIIVLIFGYAKINNLAERSTISNEVFSNSITLISLILGLGTVNNYLSAVLLSLKDQIFTNNVSIGLALLVAIACWFTLSRIHE